MEVEKTKTGSSDHILFAIREGSIKVSGYFEVNGKVSLYKVIHINDSLVIYRESHGFSLRSRMSRVQIPSAMIFFT